MTASLASISESACVNPVVNFSFGILSLILSFIAVFVYIILGRVQRVAFERRRWLIEKCVSIYGIFLYMIDEVIVISRTVVHTQMASQRNEEREVLRSAHFSFRYVRILAKKLWKPLLFILVATVEAIAIVIGRLLVASLHIIFNGMLLHRAYRGSAGASISGNNGSPSFFDRISEFISSIGLLLGLNNDFVGSISFAAVYLLQVLSFDLTTVQVPCSGSQAPINLLLDCFVAAVVLISINSDSNLLWTARVKKSMGKWMSLLLKQSYLSSIAGSIYLVVPFLVNIIPSPMKFNQYMISYVSISEFFASNGRSMSSSNCDATAAIPIDTIEAYLTTILVVVLIPPIVYLFAQVLFPSPVTTEKSPDSTFAPRDNSRASESTINQTDKWWRLLAAASSIDWFFFKSIFNLGFVMVQGMKGFILSVRESSFVSMNPMLLQKFERVFEDPLNGAALPEVVWVHALEFFERRYDIEWQTEETKWQLHTLQFPTYYTMVQLIASDALETSNIWSIFSSNRVRLGWEIFFRSVGCWIVPLQIMNSSIARKMWMNVAKNYAMYLFMSMGYWNDHTVQKLSVIEKFRAFEASVLSVQDDPDVVQTMENPLFARNSILVDSAAAITGNSNFEPGTETIKADHDEDSEILRADNNIKEMFVNFLSSMTSCRSVMWQIVPGMTAFAILAVDTSTCPILVFSEKMQLILPPLIAVDAWQDSEKVLQSMLVRQPRQWQRFLIACYLGMKNSRLVQFCHQIFINLITFYIVFTDSSIYPSVCAFVGVELCMGLITFGYSFVQLYIGWFDRCGDEDESFIE